MKRYTADKLYEILMKVQTDEEIDGLSNDDVEELIKVQSIIDRVTSHNCDCIEVMCKTIGISTEGKTIGRLACEVCAFRA